MKSLFAAGITLFATLAFAGSWEGHVIDVACKGKDPATHTRKCAIGCAKSGYGLLLSDGKFHKFDEAGSEKALEALKASSKEADLKAHVTGTLEGDVLKVESIHIH